MENIDKSIELAIEKSKSIASLHLLLGEEVVRLTDRVFISKCDNVSDKSDSIYTFCKVRKNGEIERLIFNNIYKGWKDTSVKYIVASKRSDDTEEQFIATKKPKNKLLQGIVGHKANFKAEDIYIIDKYMHVICQINNCQLLHMYDDKFLIVLDMATKLQRLIVIDGDQLVDDMMIDIQNTDCMMNKTIKNIYNDKTLYFICTKTNGEKIIIFVPREYTNKQEAKIIDVGKCNNIYFHKDCIVLEIARCLIESKAGFIRNWTDIKLVDYYGKVLLVVEDCRYNSELKTSTADNKGKYIDNIQNATVTSKNGDIVAEFTDNKTIINSKYK